MSVLSVIITHSRKKGMMSKAEMISEIALRIQQGFPGSELRLEIDGISNTYIICFEGNELIKIDDVGVFFLFPTNRKHPIKWSNVLEGGPDSVARQVHRELQQLGFRLERGKKWVISYRQR